ncbi:AAA domain-containing protein [Rapidithrix thailandica]|uniref:AAA domain-containing protein n=1 Tax=Rapidithrix thailandica TaxID=413964 RepID=A0AAW9S994_9BACT
MKVAESIIFGGFIFFCPPLFIYFPLSLKIFLQAIEEERIVKYYYLVESTLNTLHQTLKIFQKRLTNLSTKNKSLLLLRLIKSQFVDLLDFDYLNHQPAFSLIEQLIAGKASIPLLPVLDSRDNKSNTISARLQKIFRTDKFIFEESGSKDLYIGYPFVRGKMMDDTLVRCPLLFFPVSLESYQGNWLLKRREDVNITFNKTLLLAYSHYNGILFKDDFLDTDFNEYSKESREFRTQLYQLLQQSPFEIHFNQETFEDKLSPFRTYTKPEFEQQHYTGELKVYPEAVLGIFPQSSSYLVPDFDELILNEKVKDLEEFFVPSDTLHQDRPLHKTVTSKASKEEELFTPFSLDASQERAIKAVKGGNSIVVQGPPGSGKSQLICNLICDNIAHGKNVLVVCQKRAALDVVYQRLKVVGLETSSALLHDFKEDRKPLYQKIKAQIENLEYYQSENNSLDAIYLERNFIKLSREIDQATEELEEFKAALYDTRDCGLSAKELYLTSNIHEPYINLRREYNHFHFSNHSHFLNRVKSYLNYAQKVAYPSHPWYERHSFENFGVEDQALLKKFIHLVYPSFHQVQERLKELIQMEITLDECEWMANMEEDFRKMTEILHDAQTFEYFKRCIRSPKADYHWLSNFKRTLINSFGSEGVETSFDKHDLSHVQGVLLEAQDAKKSWYKWFTWKLISKNNKLLQHLLHKNQLHQHPQALDILVQRLDNRMNLEHNISQLSEQDWLTDIPEDYEKDSFVTWLKTYLRALTAKEIYKKLRNGIKYLDIERLSLEDFQYKINTLLHEVKKISALKRQWVQYLTTKQINQLTKEEQYTERLLKTLDKDFDVLCEFDRLNSSLLSLEKEVIFKLHEEIGQWDSEQFVKLFDNSIRVNWIHHLEAKNPILRSVSSDKLQLIEEQLQQSIRKKQALCKQIVLMKARERTYHDIEYNRLNNRVTYRDLHHQTNKKRNIWPIRKVIQQFSHELLELIPCWLASPETVSAVFPMQEMFDVVIFDEASQCFAEKGIPAMYRGKQVVIAGDSQQLAPFDLYQPRWEEALEDDPVLEIDSLLDLGARYLSQIQLNGHYRSQSLDLIDFSNRHFYSGQLKLIPHYKDFIENKPAIDYIKIEGEWLQNQNLPEAHKVVDLVEQLLQDEIYNIGIITFNFKQQELIRDILEERELNYPEELFIKNIENVQGDERDVILFSIGYGPNKAGKVNVQFGSLNQEKGENRLNVAITRARKKIIIVSSILPAMLNVENTKHSGPKLLKKYLHYAYDVAEGKYIPKIEAYPFHTIDWYLKHKIKEQFQQHSQFVDSLPFADLVTFDQTYQKLIFTDDDFYYQSTSAKEAHAYIPLALKHKNWSYKRYYSRQYWKQFAQLEDDLIKYIDAFPSENQ